MRSGSDRSTCYARVNAGKAGESDEEFMKIGGRFNKVSLLPRMCVEHCWTVYIVVQRNNMRIMMMASTVVGAMQTSCF